MQSVRNADSTSVVCLDFTWAGITEKFIPDFLKFIPGYPIVPGVEFVGAFWFRFSGAGSDCRRWMSRWPPKPPRQKLHDNIVNVDFAPSVAQADAVLAQFGFVDREVAVAA